MNREEFTDILFTEGFHKFESKKYTRTAYFTVKQDGYIYYLAGNGSTFFNASPYEVVGVYSEKLNVLVNAIALVEEFKRQIRTDKVINKELKPVCKVTTIKDIKSEIEDEVNSRIETYIKKKYKEDEIPEDFTPTEKKYLKELKTREDLRRYIKTGNAQTEYTGSYQVHYSFSYKNVFEYLEDPEAYIKNIYKDYMKQNEKLEHKRYVANYMENQAILALHANEQHPIRLKRLLNYTLKKKYKTISVELNEKYQIDGQPVIFEMDPEGLASVNYLESIPLSQIDWKSRKIITEKLPDIKEFPYKDIKRMCSGKTVVYEDYLAL